MPMEDTSKIKQNPVAPVLAKNSPLRYQADRVSEAFRDRFRENPGWIVAAPGRVNLIGEHTDYNDGFVLPMAIDRYVVMAGGIGSDDTFRAFSLDLEEDGTFRANDPLGKKNGDWTNYLRGVIDGYRSIGIGREPLNIAFQSRVPVGGGLSSSAALEIATAMLLEAATGTCLEGKKRALIAQQAEHDYAGVPCGIMDQFASALCREGHLMLLDCRSAEPEMVPFDVSEVGILIINSNVRHELAGGEYAERRLQCEQAAEYLEVGSLRDAGLDRLEALEGRMDDVLFRRARHIISENARTLAAARAFGAGDWEAAGSLMVASHASLRDDFEVSCPELDLLVDLAMGMGPDAGVFGSRMTGGGFGGCTVTLVRHDAVDAVTRAVGQGYSEETGLEPVMFLTRPARGAYDLG